MPIIFEDNRMPRHELRTTFVDNEIWNVSAIPHRKKLTSRMHKKHAHPFAKIFAFHLE